uniref:Wsv271-like protein n=1 Tax=Penaeus semisulcatus majanivirus TaxID=2984274 RepID=A0A9C7EYD6_9VIRU|nr:MAG: wsv271-like protein [Penaeus semisulcatus majanivirus]
MSNDVVGGGGGVEGDVNDDNAGVINAVAGSGNKNNTTATPTVTTTSISTAVTTTTTATSNNNNNDNNIITTSNNNSNNKIFKNPPIDIESIFQQNVGKIFGKAIVTYIISNAETSLGYEDDDDDDEDDDDDDDNKEDGIGGWPRSKFALINEAVKALATFIIHSSPESNRSLLELYRAEKTRLTQIVTGLAVEKHVDNPFKRAIIRHTDSGDSNIIPFLEQELKKRNPQLTASEAIKTVAHFKNDLVNIFCSRILEIISKLSDDTGMRLDLYMAIVMFVEKEYSAHYANLKDFSEVNFRSLVYDLNSYYLQQQQVKEKLKSTISPRELEALKKGHYHIPNKSYTKSPQLASNLYFKNDSLLLKLPVSVDSIYRIASFLASVKSIEEKGLFCQGIFEYVIFLSRQCLVNETSSNINYYQSLQDLDKQHISFTNSLIEFEKRFKRRLKKIELSRKKKVRGDGRGNSRYRGNDSDSNNDNVDDDNDDDNEEEEEDDDGDEDDDDDDNNNYNNNNNNNNDPSYKPVTVNKSYNNYYLASGIFGDNSIFGKKLISLVEEGDIAGLQKLTNYVLSKENVSNSFVAYYIQNLIDIISIQGERLRNIKLFNCESFDMSLSSPSLSSNRASRNKLDIFKDSMLAAREIAKSPLIIHYEGSLLTNMNDYNTNTNINNDSNYNNTNRFNNKATENGLLQIIDGILEVQSSAHGLFTDIYLSLLKKAFPQEYENAHNSGNGIIQNHVNAISPFGPQSVLSSLYAIEFVSVRRNIPRTLHLLKKRNCKRSDSDTEGFMKLNTAMESSLLEKDISEAKRKIVGDAKGYLENSGAAILNLVKLIGTENNKKNTMISPYSLNSLMKGLLTVLAKTVYMTKLGDFGGGTADGSGSVLVLTIIPEIVEWLVEHLVSQINTLVSTFLETKLPSWFDDHIYESNRKRMASTATESEIGKLFTQVMANDYLTKIESALNVPRSDQRHRLREQLIRLVVDKSMNVLRKQCWTVAIMAIVIVMDHTRVLTTNIRQVNATRHNDKSKLTAFLDRLNTNTNDKKHLKEVISAVCLSVANDAALSFARLSNSHFMHILQRFNIVPQADDHRQIRKENTKNYYYPNRRNYSTGKKNIGNNTGINNINTNNNNVATTNEKIINSSRLFLIPKRRLRKDHKQPVKQSKVTILDGIINKYQNVPN